MSETKYLKAPISEVILGISFNSDILIKHRIIFKLIEDLIQKGYEELITTPATADEDIIENKIRINIEYEKTGYSLYRLYTKNKDYLIQIQHNCILLNWIRRDEISVGKYPGFTEIFTKFNSVIENLKYLLNQYPDLAELDFNKQVKKLILTYNDRILVNENDPTSIEDLFNFSFPKIVLYTNERKSSTIINTKFVYTSKEINGNIFLTINTGNDMQGKRILSVENKIKGELIGNSIGDWFNKSHMIHLNSFEEIFNSKTLSQWK